METSWENELRNYWRIIEHETEKLLSSNCIKDMLFNNGFKNDLLQKANKRIADTYERFLDDTNDIRNIALRNGFTTNADEQRNQTNPGTLSDSGIGRTESNDTFNRQPNQYTRALNNANDTSQKSSSSSSNTSLSRSETSNPNESVIVRNIGQQVQSASHDTLNVSFSQHSTTDTPDNVAETDSIFSHEQTLSDLDHILNQNATNESSSSQNLESCGALGQLEKVLDSSDCLDSSQIEFALKLVADTTNNPSNADSDESREIKLEQDSTSEKVGNNRNSGPTDAPMQTVDLTLDTDGGPIENPSVIITSNNANKSNTKAKKRKQVAVDDAEVAGKKQKTDASSSTVKRLNFDDSHTQQSGNSTIDNARTDNDNEMPYKCNICSAESDRKSKLEAHIKAHEHDIMYRCSFCDRKFTRSQEIVWKSHEKQCSHTKKRSQKSKQTVVNVKTVTK